MSISYLPPEVGPTNRNKFAGSALAFDPTPLAPSFIGRVLILHCASSMVFTRAGRGALNLL